ncbi:Ser-Thr-rich GPI-anchored membrane family protein [Candidatus Neomarinimicrobiota bacterium]
MKYFSLIGKLIFVVLVSWFIACDGLTGLENSEMEIISPTTGDHWQVGEDTTAVIEWTQVDAFGPIRIDLYKDNAFHTNIATGARVIDLEYRWTVPGSVEPDRRFTVYIESEWDSTLHATSKQFDIDGYVTSSELTVTAPANRDTWQSGVQDNAIIRWTYSDLSGAIKIVLYNAESPVATIADSVALADTAFYWTVPQSVLAGSSHRVYLESLTDQYVGSYSDEFEILPSDTPSSLAITVPARNATWQVGLINGALVNWTHENLTGTVKIDLYQSDAFVTSIVDSVDAEAGTYTWTVPLDVVDGRNYQVYVQSNDLANVNNLSNDFKIDPFDSEPALDVVAPIGGDVWVLGQAGQALVKWAYANVSGTISIDLYTGRSTYITTIADSVDITAGSLAWTVPDTFETGAQYNVRLASHELPELQSTGPKFEIADLASVAALTVNSPTAGDMWITGRSDEVQIQWTSEYLLGTVRLDLVIPGKKDQTVMPIADDVAVDLGSFDWVVPDDSTIWGDNVYVMITSNELPTIIGESDEFSIVDWASLISLDVISPIAGDFWVRTIPDGGEITWTSDYLDGTISIDLIAIEHKSVTTTRLAESIDVELGYFSLTIADSIPVGTNYELLLTSNDMPAITARTGPISILDVADVAGLAVTLPLAGDIWVKNEANAALIEWWSSPFTTGTMRIELWEGAIEKQDVAPYMTIDSTVSIAGGSYVWTVPDSIPLGEYSVLIASNEYPGIEDFMSTVSILDSASAASITVTKPVHDAVFAIGSELLIEWDAAYLSGTLKIELYDNKLETIIEDSVAVSDGSYLWEEITVGPNARYFIRLESNEFPDIFDDGDLFEIE